eukprot:6491626-Amphidinium_carterae.1
MENGFGQSIIQVDTEPAIKQFAEEAARELTIPWRQLSYLLSHTHEGQGSVERFHQTLFSQVRAIRFDMVDRCNLGGPDNVPESLLPWSLQHACFTINRYLVHADGMTNYQRRCGVQCNSATCSFGEVVLADIKPITVNQLDIRSKEKKTEGIWLGKTTNSGEHIIATMDESGKAFYTRSLTRLTPELQWDKKICHSTDGRLNE